MSRVQAHRAEPSWCCLRERCGGVLLLPGMIQRGKSAPSWSTRQNFGESGGFVSIVYQGRENTVGTVSTVCDQGHGHAALTMLTVLTQTSLSGKSR